MIFFRDKEYILEADVQTAKANTKDVDLQKGLDQLKKNYEEYKQTHNDISMKQYVIDIFNNKINYEETTTSTPQEQEPYTTTTTVSPEVEQSATNAMSAAANVTITI